MSLAGFRINDPDVIYQQFADETVAIHLKTGAYHSLPGIAGEAFLCLSPAGATLHEIAAQLATRFEARSEDILADLIHFFSQLERESLVAQVTFDQGRTGTDALPQLTPRLPYLAPSLASHSDLNELFLIDPIHDVSAAGWPNIQPEPVLAITATAEHHIAGPHVIFQKMGDETVLMNLETAAYYSLSGPAEDVFPLFEHKPSLEELRSALLSKYSASEDEIDSALRSYLDELLQAGLIVAHEPETLKSARTLALISPGSNVPFMPIRLASFQEPATPGVSSQPTGIIRFRLRPNDLLMASAGGETLVADRQFGDYYRLNQPTIDVFSLLSQEAFRADQLVVALLRKYDVPERQLTAAVIILLRHLAAMNLVVSEPAEPSENSPGADLPVPALKVPFAGFRCEIHKDLRELMSPFNVQEYRNQPTRASSTRFFVDSLREYFAEICKSESKHFLKVAGYSVQLKSANTKLTDELVKATSHLCESGKTGAADLIIHIWDADTPPSDPYFASILERLFRNWQESCGPRGELIGIHGSDVAAIYHPGPDILSVVDRSRGEAFFLKRDLSPLPYWEIGSPFRYIFHSWFAARGLQFVHGGAVGDATGGVLLTAKGGSGKSTTTMLCAKSGMQFAGDDYCVVDPQTGYLHSLYNSSKLKGMEDLTRLPDVTGLSRNPDSFENGGSGKAIYFLSEVWLDRLTAGFPLRAILIPSVTGSVDSRLERCSPGDALLAIMPSTVAQLPAADKSDCERLAALVEKLPAYHLYLGTDVDQIPPLVRQAASH